MFQKIDDLLKKRTNEVVFLDLKDEVLIGDNIKIGNDMPIPILLKDLQKKVKGVETSDIELNKIVDGMIFILGIDLDFKYRDEYVEFLKTIDSTIGNKILNNAIVSANKGDKKDALVLFRASIVIDGKTLDNIYNYGRCCGEIAFENADSESGKKYNNESFNAFKYLVKNHPDSPLGYYHLGFLYSNAKKYEQAMKCWKKTLSLDIDDNKYDEVLKNIKKLSDKAEYERGYKLILNQRAQEGLEILKTLEQDHAEWWNLMFFIGLGYRMIEEYEEAIKYFNKVLALNSGHIETYNEIGLCFMALHIYSEAEAAFKEALKIKPDNSEILCNLGIVYIQLGNMELAQEYLSTSYELNPDDEITNAWLDKIDGNRTQ